MCATQTDSNGIQQKADCGSCGCAQSASSGRHGSVIEETQTVNGQQVVVRRICGYCSAAL